MSDYFRTHDGRTLEQAASDLVQREVLCCMSGVVSTLAQCDTSHFDRRGGNPQAELCDAAVELCAPVLDYEEAAREAGYQVRHDYLGFYVCDADEAEAEDAGAPSAGFDGRHHAHTIEAAAQEWCEAEAVDPCEREVFEHWAVSTWLAEKLHAAGERVDTDFAGLCVWARTTTGQAIHADAVVEQITREMHEARA